MNMQPSQSLKKNNGFTLVEMAIVLAIVGLLVGGGLSFYKPLDQNIRTTDTKERMQRVANALSAYALRNNRIPCPADPAATSEPFGAERGSGSSGTDIGYSGCTTVALANGIVPYRTLGIRQEDIIDGFGSYLTYHVSPIFTTNDNTNDNVHDHCRQATSWFGSVTDTSGSVIYSADNLNPAKARFCCPASNASGGLHPNTDIVMNDQSGVAVLPRRDTGAANYGNVDSEVTSTVTGDTLAVVYTLISHGANRYGKFLVGSTTPTDKYTASPAGENEIENQDPDSEFYDGPEISVAGTNYYDDIVLWRTQDSLISELGTNSCAQP